MSRSSILFSLSASRQPQQRANGQRVLADAADHHVAAGFDALGDRDLALARQQLDRAHLAQIHAHGVVGAADIVVIDIAAGFGLAVLGLGFGRLLALLALDQVDAELGEHRHRVLDLLRGHLILRQRGVQLVIGQIAALLAARHHLLDRVRNRVEERSFGRFFPGLGRVRRRHRLARHAVILRLRHIEAPRPAGSAMPLPYAFISLCTADLQFDAADRAFLQFPLLERRQPARVLGRGIGRERTACRLDFAAAAGLQELEGFLEALPDHLRIVSSAHGKACMPGCRDRQSAERLCVAARR